MTMAFVPSALAINTYLMRVADSASSGVVGNDDTRILMKTKEDPVSGGRNFIIMVIVGVRKRRVPLPKLPVKNYF